MKRPKKEYGLELDPNACYKMEYLHHEAKEEFESINNWLYLGGDARDNGFAKVGITMGDLSSRSSCSGRPSYYIFCAFKCRRNIERSRLEYIERSALSYLDSVFTYPDGSTKRELHADSGVVSECFRDIDFTDFFICLHDYLYDDFLNDFILSGFESELGFDEGEFIDCEFNPRMPLVDVNRNIRRFLRL